MGMSCLIQARRRPSRGRSPAFVGQRLRGRRPAVSRARSEANQLLVDRARGLQDTIRDTEEIRRELLKVAYGVWDHLKNRCTRHDMTNWGARVGGHDPGKRESRRYVGDYIINQNDVRTGGRFDDVIAFAGWPMDDHHPAGMLHPGEPTIFHPAPCPWGIPYRSIYSRNVSNLFMAGRNISAPHIALASSRTMRTCATIGQAAGTAAAVAVSCGISPREVGRRSCGCSSSGSWRTTAGFRARSASRASSPPVRRCPASAGDPEMLRNGFDRPIDNDRNCWEGPLGGWVELRFERPVRVSGARLILDSNLARHFNDMRQRSNYALGYKPAPVAPELIRGFRIDYESRQGWKTAFREEANHLRLHRSRFEPVESTAFRFVPETSWGNERVCVFGCDLL